MLSINLSHPSAHAVAARAAHEQKLVPSSDELIREIDRKIQKKGDLKICKITRMQPMLQRTRLSFHKQVVSEYEHVPSPDELIKEIDKEIEKKGDLKIIRAATIRELDEIIEPSNELQELWKKWQYFVKVDERLDKEITPTPNEEEELKKIHMILLNNIKFNQRKIAVLLSKICVNRDTNNKNVLHTSCPVKHDDCQTEAPTLTTRLRDELRCKKTMKPAGLKETRFHQPERREYQWQSKVNDLQTPYDIGTTIKTEADREEIIISNSPVNYCVERLLFGSTPPGLY